MDRKLKKGLILSIIILLILDMPFILYLLNFKLVAFNNNFYKKEFSKHDIYDEFPEDDIEIINSELLYYLRYEKTDEYVRIDLFDEREKEHLVDVKNVIQKILISLNIMIILFIILIITLIFINKKEFKKNISIIFLYGGIITFLDAFITFIIINFNFNFLFDLFHKTFFQEGTWLFDEGSDIVRLYTSHIFYDATLRIVIQTLIIALILLLMGLFYYKRILKNKKNTEIPK